MGYFAHIRLFALGMSCCCCFKQHTHSSVSAHNTQHPQHTHRYKIVTFNSLASQASISLLLLSAISIVLPTAALHLSFSGDSDERLSNEE